MKKYLLIAVVLLSVAGLQVPAHAQEEHLIVTTVPFEFIVGTQTLPAGTYTVSRTSAWTNSALLISNREHGVFLLPTAFDSAEMENASLTFDQIGDEHVLNQIKTPTGIYTIDNHRAAERLTKLAHSNDHSGATAMSSSGGQ